MAGERKLTVVLAGDSRGMERTLDGASKSLGGFESKLGKIAGAVGGAFAADKLVDFGGQLLATGGQLTAIDTKVRTVFEGGAAAIRKWADKNNESFGLTDDQLAGLAANFGDLLKPMGFTAEQAAKMSTDVVGLAGALSSWSGGTISASGAADKLAAAMLGETDGLKELGIAISAADIDARLAAKGQDKLTGSALEQAKAVATQELIFEKSTDAQKAWAEGGNKALTASNKWKAGLGELKETLATKLVPVILILSNFLMEKVAPALAKVGQFVKDNQGPFIALAVVVGGALTAAFASWAVSAGAAAAATLVALAPVLLIGAAVAAVAFVIIKNWDTIKAATKAVFDGIVGFATGAWDSISSGATAAKDWVVARWNDAVGFVTGLPGRVTSAVAGLWDGITSGFKAAINGVIRMWNNFKIEFEGYDIPGPGPNIPGFRIDTPNLPLLHGGGIFDSGRGEGPALLKDGEGVFTPEQMAAMGSGSGEVHLHFHGPVAGADGKRWVLGVLQDARRQGLLGAG